jgi:ABC-type polar amino acid transport system ATPase subunit
MTMLVVTHEMDFARSVSNKVIFMEGGKVIEEGPSKEFFESPKEARSWSSRGWTTGARW